MNYRKGLVKFMNLVKIKLRAKKFFPAHVLQFYRLIRTFVRRLLRKPSDYLNSRNYREQIYARFPELRTKPQSGLVLDLGANLGHFSAACISMGYKVTAVEPHPDAILYLESRFSSNPGIRIVKKAISPDSPTTFLQLHPDHRNDPLTTSFMKSLKTGTRKLVLRRPLSQIFLITAKYTKLSKLILKGQNYI